jgi:hypothetical protein
MRFDYAWKWFDFHAEQRTKMFNFMLVGLGVLATPIVSALKDCSLVEALGMSIGAVLLAIAFWRLDARNRNLYLVALDVLIDAEKKTIFGNGVKFLDRDGEEKDFGIARRLSLEEQALEETLSQGHFTRRKIADGQHRYLMPFVAWVFIALFSLCVLLSLRGLITQTCTATGSIPSFVNLTLPGSPAQPGGAGSTNQLQMVGDDALVLHPVVNHEPWFWWTLAGGLGLVVAGALALATGRKVIGCAAIVAGAATTVLPHFSVPISAKFQIDPKFEGKLADKIGLDLKLNPEFKSGGGAQSQGGLLASARFKGFGQGIELFSCSDTSSHEGVAAIRAAVADARQRHLQTVVFIVGSTDRRELSPPLRARFESNSGLARARARSVEQCLDLTGSAATAGAHDVPAAPVVVSLISGPAYVPATADKRDVVSQMMADDRSVSVFVLGFVGPGK